MCDCRIVFWGAVVSVAMSQTLAMGATPTYSTFQLQARTNFASNPGGSFNIPGSWFFSGETIGLNDPGGVAFRLSVTSGDFHALWVGGNGTGAVRYQSPTGSSLSTATINNGGFVCSEQQFSGANGVYVYDPNTMTTALFTNRPLGASSWSSVRINNAGQVGFRASFAGSGTAYVSSAGEAFPPFHVSEVGVDSMSPYSFLFTPSFNNNRQIAGKGRRGAPGQFGESQPDEIRIFNADGSSTLIAEDVDANAASPFARFDNSVALNDNGWVAFTASLVPFPAAGRGVFVSNGVTTRTIALIGGGLPVSNIEFFAPAINNSELVAFRAFDTAGLRAIWVGDGVTLNRVVTEHDVLPSDLGSARVDQHDASPVFGGGMTINSAGHVAFNCGLTPPANNQIEWGTGIYVAFATVPPPPACPGDANGDRVVNFDDITSILSNWNMPARVPHEGGDANGDGFVDFEDITSALSNWNVNCP